jgi:NADPH2:quinone reductase
MVSVVRLTRTGTPDVLTIENADQAAPIEGQVWIEQQAINVNYLDVMQRKGTAPLSLPSGLGLEGAGIVTAVGPGVTDVAAGDRVGYAVGPIGSYASGQASSRRCPRRPSR